jgi:hypothetical protein
MDVLISFVLANKSTLSRRIMNKRGRPKGNGQVPMWMPRRVTLIIHGYDLARGSGEKHAAAIKEAVRYVRETDSRLRISETEVRRVLASWRPKDKSLGLVVVEPTPSENTITLPDGGLIRIGLTAAVGPRPIYPRANAVQKPSSHHNT